MTGFCVRRLAPAGSASTPLQTPVRVSSTWRTCAAGFVADPAARCRKFILPRRSGPTSPPLTSRGTPARQAAGPGGSAANSYPWAVGDPDGALAKGLEQKDAPHVGRAPAPIRKHRPSRTRRTPVPTSAPAVSTATISSARRRMPYPFPSSKSMAQQPRTCEPGERRWPSKSASVQPTSFRASATTARRAGFR